MRPFGRSWRLAKGAFAMIPWSEIDTTAMPDGGGELRLMRRGAEFSIMSGAIELMNSRSSGSERALASLACSRLQDRPRPHLLIGGFGMGFTLRAALEALGPEAKVTGAELVPAVIAWAGARAHGASVPGSRRSAWPCIAGGGGHTGPPIQPDHGRDFK